jgi:hypothetical protein
MTATWGLFLFIGRGADIGQVSGAVERRVWGLLLGLKDDEEVSFAFFPRPA